MIVHDCRHTLCGKTLEQCLKYQASKYFPNEDDNVLTAIRVWRASTSNEKVQLKIAKSLMASSMDSSMDSSNRKAEQDCNYNYNYDWILLATPYLDKYMAMGKSDVDKESSQIDSINIGTWPIFMIEKPNAIETTNGLKDSDNASSAAFYGSSLMYYVKYARDHEQYSVNWRIKLEIGSFVECLDTELRTPKWYAAIVKDIVDQREDTSNDIDIDFDDGDVQYIYNGLQALKLFRRQFVIKYIGYSDRFNDVIQFDSQRLAPMFTHTQLIKRKYSL